MQLVTRLIEQLRKKPSATSVVINQSKQLLGERPNITFAKLWNHYLEDPTIQNAINSFRDHIVGSGFYITANSSKVVKIVNEFCSGVGFDNILYDLVGEMLICGNSFLAMLTLQVTDIVYIRRAENWRSFTKLYLYELAN